MAALSVAPAWLERERGGSVAFFFLRGDISSLNERGELPVLRDLSVSTMSYSGERAADGEDFGSPNCVRKVLYDGLAGSSTLSSEFSAVAGWLESKGNDETPSKMSPSVALGEVGSLDGILSDDKPAMRATCWPWLLLVENIPNFSVRGFSRLNAFVSARPVASLPRPSGFDDVIRIEVEPAGR